MSRIMHKNSENVSPKFHSNTTGYLTCFLALLLTGCASVAPPSVPTKTSWQQRETSLSHLKSWHINGKIGVQTANDSGSASLDWIQKNQQYTISLMGPLGSGSIKIAGHPGSVTLDAPNGKQFTANNPEQLLAQQWGWHLPVSHINYWVRGLPAPGTPSQTEFDEFQRLRSLTQENWNVQFLSYTKVGSMELPSKISLVSSDLKSKIIIYSWKID